MKPGEPEKPRKPYMRWCQWCSMLTEHIGARCVYAHQHLPCINCGCSTHYPPPDYTPVWEPPRAAA